VNDIWGDDWPSVRELYTLDRGVAHLNNGSFGVVPIPVAEEQRRLMAEIETDPNRFFGRDIGEAIERARYKAARFLRSDPDGIAFVENTTTGVASVLSSIDLREGDEILVTTHGYHAVLVASRMLCERNGARVVVQPAPYGTPDEIVDAVLSGVTERTRLVFVDHVSSPTSLRFPVERIVPTLRERGVLCMVDGAHAPGMLDVDLGSLDPDLWVGNFHKWAGAPRGAAALYAREELREIVKPAVRSHLSEERFPLAFIWLGTQDVTPYLCVPFALRFFEELGWDRVRTHNATLAKHGGDVLLEALHAEAPAPDVLTDGVAMRSAPLPDGLVANEDGARALVARIADEAKAETAVTLFDDRAFLRVSAQIYNRPDEYERLADVLPGIIGS
jgi:isopenicillin-N epimerase